MRYIGGTIVVRDNIKTGTTNKNNFFISDTDAYLNHAAGQPEVPNKPLTEGAYVGITTKNVDFCMSDSDSRFTMNSVNYLSADTSPYMIRPVYNKADGNHICDICESYILTDFAIVNYNAQTIDAIVITPDAGEYTLAFADYENGELKNVSIVTFDSKVGLNKVSQVKNYFTLGSGDKIMLWRDITDCVPLCQSYIVK